MQRIANGKTGWTIALRLIIVNAASCADSALGIFADLAVVVASTTQMRIAVASRMTGALDSIRRFATLGVGAARSSQALVAALFAVDGGIAVVSRGTRALRFSIDDATLGREAASSLLEAGIRAHAEFTAGLVGVAILVLLTLELVTFLARLALVTFGA